MSKYKDKVLEEWNVRDFHDYLTQKNKDKYGVDYAPFGRGPVSQRWRVEQGQLKNAKEKYGNEVVKRFIDKCFETHYFNPKFPCLSFGFMFSYKQEIIPSIQYEMKQESERKKTEQKAKQKEEGVDDDWF